MEKYDFKTDEEKNLEQLEKERVLNDKPFIPSHEMTNEEQDEVDEVK